MFHIDAEEWCATLMALYTMATYVYTIWNSFPYIFLLAERGSGKSRVLKMLSMLCSMGLYWVSPRPSPLFRTVDALHPSLFMDETELMNDDDQAEIVNLINAGYQKGALVPRTNTDNGMAVEMFDAYCPKGLASTKPPSPTLESRSLKIPLRRTRRPEDFVKRDPAFHRDAIKMLNQNQSYWSIENGIAIANIELDDILKKYTDRFKDVPARTLEIMFPLLCIYEFLGLEFEDEEENLAKIIEYQSQEQKTSTINDADQRVVVALWSMVNQSESTISTKKIINELLKADGIAPGTATEEELKFYSPGKIGNILKTLHVPSKNIDGRKQYMRDLDLDSRVKFVRDLLEAYSIDVSSAVGAKDQSDKPKGQQSFEVPHINTGTGGTL
jgi:hypothetical protein